MSNVNRSAKNLLHEATAIVVASILFFSCTRDLEYEIHDNHKIYYQINGTWQFGEQPALYVGAFKPNSSEKHKPTILNPGELEVFIQYDSTKVSLDYDQSQGFVGKEIESYHDKVYTLVIIHNNVEVVQHTFSFPAALNFTQSLVQQSENSWYSSIKINNGNENQVSYWKRNQTENVASFLALYSMGIQNSNWSSPNSNLNIESVYWYPVNMFEARVYIYNFLLNDVEVASEFFRWNKTTDPFKQPHNASIFGDQYAVGSFVPYVIEEASIRIKGDTIPFLRIRNKSPDKISGYRIISTSYSDRRYYASFKDIDSKEYTKNDLVRMFILPTLPSPVEGLRDQVPGIEMEITPFHLDEATGIETALPPLKHTIGTNYEVITLE